MPRSIGHPYFTLFLWFNSFPLFRTLDVNFHVTLTFSNTELLRILRHLKVPINHERQTLRNVRTDSKRNCAGQQIHGIILDSHAKDLISLQPGYLYSVNHLIDFSSLLASIESLLSMIVQLASFFSAG